MARSQAEPRHRVVIVGGGFAGLYAARTLGNRPVDVTLVDRRNFHLFQPLLYQVATGGLSPANIATPLRRVLARYRNVRVILGEVVDFEPEQRRVVLSDDTLSYDSLIIAAGSRHHYFGQEGWEHEAPGLKSIENATEIRRRILLAFERAERETDPERIRAHLTFAVVGGGPTGVELAGALAELAHDTLDGDFRSIDPNHTRIVLLEGGPRILHTYPPKLSARAERSLRRMGVTSCTGARVTEIHAAYLRYLQDEEEHVLPTHTVLWAAGVAPSPLAHVVARAFRAEQDRQGRLVVEPDCTLKDHPEVAVLGDMAHFVPTGKGEGERTGEPLPGTAPVAMQQGRAVARNILRRVRGRPPRPFRFRDKGTMAVIGRTAAVVDLGWIGFGGILAWWVWLFVHLMYIVEFGNRLLVLLQWSWNYWTYKRSARLITGPDPLPLLPPAETRPPEETDRHAG